MPVSKYFGGSGEKVMKAMKKEYGEEKGKEVFYATANKRKRFKSTARGRKNLEQGYAKR